MKTPHAFTLVELVTSLSVGSVLLVLAIGTVHRTLRIESTMQTNAKTERTNVRLSQQFRRDIRIAESVSIDRQHPEKPVLHIVMPSRTLVSYTVNGGNVHRQQPYNDKLSQHEYFSFPENYIVNISETPASQMVALTVHSNTGLVDVPPRLEMRVESVIGHFLRLKQPVEATQ